MLEILLLVFIYRKLGAIAESKNREKSWGWLGVLLWISGEVLGFMFLDMSGGITAYLTILLFAAVGAAIAFMVVSSLSVKPAEDFPTAKVV